VVINRGWYPTLPDSISVLRGVRQAAQCAHLIRKSFRAWNDKPEVGALVCSLSLRNWIPQANQIVLPYDKHHCNGCPALNAVQKHMIMVFPAILCGLSHKGAGHMLHGIIVKFTKECFRFAGCFLRTRLTPDFAKDMEILLLRSQLSLLLEKLENNKLSKPRATPAFRLLAVCLSKWFTGWRSSLVIVKPQTVIRWHKTAFKIFWRLKSKKPGRPKISQKTIMLIKKLHRENPLLSPEKIYECLVNLGVTDAPAPNTIAKYFPALRQPPSQKQLQSWRIFLKNEKLWAMDFFTVPTLRFQVLYVFIMVNHAKRRIEHFGVTANPNAGWIAQQIRNATPFGKQPNYLLHDNDSNFTASFLQNFLSNMNIQSVRTALHSPWQNGIAERTIGIIRQDILNHVIPLNQNHLQNILHEYITGYYNPHRTHQGLSCRTPNGLPCPFKTTAAETTLISHELLGGLYHAYEKTA